MNVVFMRAGMRTLAWVCVLKPCIKEQSSVTASLKFKVMQYGKRHQVVFH